jgi:hypothetical protein
LEEIVDEAYIKDFSKEKQRIYFSDVEIAIPVVY